MVTPVGWPTGFRSALMSRILGGQSASRCHETTSACYRTQRFWFESRKIVGSEQPSMCGSMHWRGGIKYFLGSRLSAASSDMVDPREIVRRGVVCFGRQMVGQRDRALEPARIGDDLREHAGRGSTSFLVNIGRAR